MYVYRALFNIDIATPDLVQQLRPGIDPFLVGHEKLQQPVLGGAHGQGAFRRGYPVADRVQGQPVHFDRAVDAGRRCPAQYRFQPGNQFPRAEGLGDVIIGADFQALDLVVFLNLGGQHDNRDVGGCLFLFQPPCQLDTTGAREHPVQQDQVWLPVNYQGVGLAGILCLEVVVISHFEGHGDHFADGWLVIDDQDSFSIHVLQPVSEPREQDLRSPVMLLAHYNASLLQVYDTIELAAVPCQLATQRSWSATSPANTANPAQLLFRKALKQPSRARSRARYW